MKILRIISPVIFVFLLPGFVSAQDCGVPPPGSPPQVKFKLKVVSSSLSPVLSPESKGAEGVVSGFEGGTVIKVDGIFHAFTTEMTTEIDGDLFTNTVGFATRLALWSSPDGDHWTRTRTLFASSSDYTGQDRRAALWAPMPIYDEDRGEWNLFYVAYRSKPSTPKAYYANYDGEIVRAVSKIKGKGGFEGPYVNAGIILGPDTKSNAWDALNATDSFFAYRTGNGWMGFFGYGTSDLKPIFAEWRVGLAAAPSLTGPWRRCSSLNPSQIVKHFIENPVVSRIGSTYLAIYDVDVDTPNAYGYAESQDGVYWTPGQLLQAFTDPKITTRTPLALIDDGHGGYDLFATAFVHRKDKQGKDEFQGHLFHFKVKVEFAGEP